MSYVFAFLREAGLTSVVSLDGTDFRTVNWSQANLSGANLSGANLRNANLSEANLRNADLSNADLSQAKLCEIIGGGLDERAKPIRYIRQANLRGAILSFADLWEAERRGTIVSAAQMKKAKTPPSLSE